MADALRVRPRARAAASPGRGWGRACTLGLFAVCLPACERGCVSTWLRDHGVAGRPSPSSAASFPVNGVDCPDGLARCVGGVVEVSRVSRYELPCSGSPESCMCPWDSLGDCPRGCAAEGVEAVIARDRAFAQLCAPDPSDPTEAFARPAAGVPPPPGACEEGGIRCIASLVVACRESALGGAGDVLTPRTVAVCLRGCAHEGDAIDEEDVADEAAARILCAR